MVQRVYTHALRDNVRDDASDTTSVDVEAGLERLHARSYGWALACCRDDPSQAADVLQASYLKVIDGRARFGGRSSLATWFFAVIRRTAAEHRRKAFWRRFVPMTHRPEEPAYRAGPHEAFQASALQTQIAGALAQLPQRQREVAELVFYQDMSLEQASQVMKVSVGTARTHYHRAKQKLAQLLADAMKEECP